ncbi:MAG TPA: hypothetical protein VH597_15630 [Verrucomicrobiae bacterium]|jgi:hypothetical protein|nr:hypothetical protein [Verrucomicrobiae bacterium]
MSDSAEAKPIAWQPLTPRGVAAFARAPGRRLLVVQFLFALAAAVTVVWFLRTAWFPTVRAATKQLPVQGRMQSGKLNWVSDSPALLAEGHFLAFVVDTNHVGTVRSPAHIQVEFGRDDIYFYSLVGYREWPYPGDWSFGFNRDALQPWWGAWEAPVQWLAFCGMLLWCLVSWTLLATVYVLPVWLGGFFANRDLSLRQSWKLAGAALMPGALVMIVAILFYGFGVLDVVQLAAACGVHIVVSWVYLIWGVSVSPRLSPRAVASQNPFENKAALE